MSVKLIEANAGKIAKGLKKVIKRDYNLSNQVSVFWNQKGNVSRKLLKESLLNNNDCFKKSGELSKSGVKSIKKSLADKGLPVDISVKDFIAYMEENEFTHGNFNKIV